MISVVCPYCEYGIGIIFDNCMRDLITKGSATCTCTKCKNEFIISNGKNELEVKKKIKKMKAIVAIDRNWAIGKNNQLLFHIPEDMKFFKDVTTNNTVVMGRKTYESIGKELPNRNNIILTHNHTLNICNHNSNNRYKTFTMDDTSFKNYYENTTDNIFIIGGESVYKKYLDQCGEIYVTMIDAEVKGADKFFPNLTDTAFKLNEIIKEDKYNNITFKITKWIK